MTFAETLGNILAPVNACLNATSAVLVFTGVAAIRRKATAVHQRRMTAAFYTSALFLASYLTRFALTGSHPFPGSGWLKVVYLLILVSHMILATATLPLVLRTLFLGRRGRYVEHRKIARWTYPIWAYVSVTGVIVYVMLYHLA